MNAWRTAAELLAVGLVILLATVALTVALFGSPFRRAMTADSAPCAVGQVKATASGLYHVPGGRWYAATRHCVCFDTEADAIGAGFGKAGG